MRSNIPERQPKPMSTVPPSPPWPTTRVSVLPLALSAAAIPVATAGALPNSEWTHGIRHELSGYGVVNTSRHPVALAAMTVHRGAERCVKRVAGAERFAAPLAGTVAAGDRVGSLRV